MWCADVHCIVRLWIYNDSTWWHHQMEACSALLALCAGNSPVTGEFPSQRPVTRSFYVFFDLGLNKPLSKRLWGWWFKTPSCSLWHHCNDMYNIVHWVYGLLCFWHRLIYPYSKTLPERHRGNHPIPQCHWNQSENMGRYFTWMHQKLYHITTTKKITCVFYVIYFILSGYFISSSPDVL